MPNPLTLRCVVSDDGHLSKSAREQIARVLPLYAGRDVEVTIRPPRRSLSANAYYWSVIVAEAQRGLIEGGVLLTSEQTHEWLKRRHLPVRTVEVLGEPLTLPASTAALDSTEFFFYVEAVRTDEALAALGCYFPDPGEYQAAHGRFRSFKIAEPA